MLVSKEGKFDFIIPITLIFLRGGGNIIDYRSLKWWGIKKKGFFNEKKSFIKWVTDILVYLELFYLIEIKFFYKM